MANQNRSMSGPGCDRSTRPTPYSGRSGSNRPMPYSGRSGSTRPMPYSGRDLSSRTMRDTDRSGSAANCPRGDARTLPSDITCGPKKDNACGDRDSRNVTCVATANFPVGMAYVPMQMWGPLYDHQKALCQGTLFPELDKPFMGGRAAR